MNAQKRKSRPFEGMIRKAVVIVPSDEDYKARIEAQEKANSKEVPDNGVMEMKGIDQINQISFHQYFQIPANRKKISKQTADTQKVTKKASKK